MFIKNDSFDKQAKKLWISLLSVLPHKLATSLSNIDTTSTLPYADQPKLFGQLGRCALCKTVYYHHEVQYLKIISNVVSYYLSFCFEVKWIAKRVPNQCFNALLHYSDGDTKLWLTIQNVFMFYFSKGHNELALG